MNSFEPYRLVPKSIPQNAGWRAWLLEQAAKDDDTKLLIKKWCRASPLFWINAFAWALDTREQKGTVSPFVTYECQDQAITEIWRSIHPLPGDRQEDLMVLKSRDMGATWMFCLIFIWLWQFHPDLIELFAMSYKEDLVDGGPKTIFGKMAFTLEQQPSWLVPKYKRTWMSLQNLDTGSMITGDTTTSRSGVSGRYLAMFFDEFPLVESQGVSAERLYLGASACTYCRIVNGTFNGTHSYFYKLSKMPDSVIKKVRLHWSQHPVKARGIAKDATGKMTSPWYVRECQRLGNNKQAIAENLDIDAQSSGWQFFDTDEIMRLVNQFAKPPLKSGLVMNERWQDVYKGKMQIWSVLTPAALPPPARYGIGTDVASGAGGRFSTPSCFCVVNLDTGEKVAQFADPFQRPERFAQIVARVARWYYDALVIWESRGPGGSFGRALLETQRYTNVYLRKRSERTLSPEFTDEPGWNPDPDSKRDLLESYRAALSDGYFLNPSREALEECLNFVYDGRSVSHALESVKDDPSGAKANHGDQVIADALAWLLVRDDGTVLRRAQLQEGDEFYGGEPPVGSMAWRDRRELQELGAYNDGWGSD